MNKPLKLLFEEAAKYVGFVRECESLFREDDDLITSYRLYDLFIRAYEAGVESSPAKEDLQKTLAYSDELKKQNKELKQAVIRWRERHWPGTDQKAVVEREFPDIRNI